MKRTVIILVLIFLAGCISVERGELADEALEEAYEELEELPEQEETTEETIPEITGAAAEEPPAEEEPEETEPEQQEEEPEVTQNPLEILILPGKFEPKDLTIKAGETVTWVNENTAAMYITGPTGTFNAKVFPEDSYSYTFEEPGKYAIIKVVDPIFYGYIYVE